MVLEQLIASLSPPVAALSCNRALVYQLTLLPVFSNHFLINSTKPMRRFLSFRLASLARPRSGTILSIAPCLSPELLLLATGDAFRISVDSDGLTQAKREEHGRHQCRQLLASTQSRTNRTARLNVQHAP